MSITERLLKSRYNDMLSRLDSMRVNSPVFGHKSAEQLALEKEMRITLHCIYVCEGISMKNSLIHIHMLDLRYEKYNIENF